QQATTGGQDKDRQGQTKVASNDKGNPKLIAHTVGEPRTGVRRVTRPQAPAASRDSAPGTATEASRTPVEAEAARERVLLALHIASSTLGEAQRMVQGDERSSK